MKRFHGLSSLFISFCIHLIHNQVSSINIPAKSLDFESPSAGPQNTPDFENSIWGVTSIGTIDPAFTLAPIFLGEKLRPLPCLLNSVDVALQLALEDFDGLLFETVYRLDSYPQVEIAIIPDEEGGSVPRKYAVWGLNLGIGLMMAKSSFETALFLLSYRGEGVAHIRFKAAGVSDITLNGTTNATQSVNKTLSISHIQASTNISTTRVDATNDPHLEVSFQLTGSVITIYDIFYVALDMLRDMAPINQRACLGDAITRVPDANLDLSTRETNPPRTAYNPPYFQAEWLMRALAQTPVYMLEQRSFRELDMVLFVDEMKVGEASVRRPTSGTGLLPASGNVSNS